MAVIATVSVVLVGVMLKEKKTEMGTGTEMMQTEEAETTGEVLASESEAEELEEYDEEAEYFAQVKKNEETVKEHGTVYSQEEDIIYNSLRYYVKTFCIFDTYEEFEKSEYYNSDYLTTNTEESHQNNLENDKHFVYAEIEVTNENRYEMEFLPSSCEIVCTQDDCMNYELNSKFYGYVYNCIYLSKRDGWEEIDDVEIEKLSRYYYISVGETVTIAVGGFSFMEEYNKMEGSELEFLGSYNVEEIYSEPQYYIAVLGNMPSSGDITGKVEDIYKNLNHIYIKCE